MIRFVQIILARQFNTNLNNVQSYKSVWIFLEGATYPLSAVDLLVEGFVAIFVVIFSSFTELISVDDQAVGWKM